MRETAQICLKRFCWNNSFLEDVKFLWRPITVDQSFFFFSQGMYTGKILFSIFVMLSRRIRKEYRLAQPKSLL